MTSTTEKGGGTFEGVKVLLCENPLPPIEEAIAAAQAEVPRGNYYTEAYSAPLRRLLSEQIGVPERLIHINAGSELILRQLFDRFGQQVHLLTPTYSLFSEIARRHSETRLLPEKDFLFDLAELRIPDGTTLAVIVNPNNPNGGNPGAFYCRYAWETGCSSRWSRARPFLSSSAILSCAPNRPPPREVALKKSRMAKTRARSKASRERLDFAAIRLARLQLDAPVVLSLGNSLVAEAAKTRDFLCWHE